MRIYLTDFVIIFIFSYTCNCLAFLKQQMIWLYRAVTLRESI